MNRTEAYAAMDTTDHRHKAITRSHRGWAFCMPLPTDIDHDAWWLEATAARSEECHHRLAESMLDAIAAVVLADAQQSS